MNLESKQLPEIILDKKVLFITTKNIDYIRNMQEIRILNEFASGVEIISSNKKNYMLRVLSVWNKIKRSKIRQADIIFIGFAPQLIIPFLAGRLKKKTIIVDFFISIYDTLIFDRKWFRDGSTAAKICHRLDDVTLKRANHVITDTKAHADYFISEFNSRVGIFETIYLEADPTIYYPRHQNKPEELKDKFIVLYFGSILPLQGVDVVLDAIKELKDLEDIYFDIIGPVPEKYHKPIQGNVRYTNWLLQEELAERIANADICLAGHFDGEIAKAKRTIPGKAYIYEAMGRPMILGDGMANRELFSSDNKHRFVAMGDSKELVYAIIQYKREYWEHIE